ncbi:AAA family ATPase [Actinopolymorpha sp. NPDC004070]|uniref:bifunctional aminoglycoside phosphotransferase/ATP-binding protein n=1 Tax=Actinopolymorpha sp. NPDC004070 TaxID=3154548 RepID=UPI0033A3731D
MPGASGEASGGEGAAFASAALAESHSAVVVFVGDRAYKVKKPVDLGFLDFTTVRAREEACRRELELNRRLAPDVYLEVRHLVDDAGETRDWVLVMRRMPSARRLSTLVAAGADVRHDLRELARLLAAFHARAPHGAKVAAAGRPSALLRRWRDNLAGAEPFVGEVLDPGTVAEIARLVERYVGGRGALLNARARAGLVVDGHGDLLADDIFCLPDGPRVLDCLEFDDALRYVDGVDDAAFLAMDLERLGAPDLAESFLGWYGDFTGGLPVASLVHHYVAYRAFVRAKVACLRFRQGMAPARATARQLAGLTLDHLHAGEVRLVLVGGLPGTGKSTVAGALADRMGAVVLRTDEIRREKPGARLPTPREETGGGGYQRGRYTPARVHAAYRELLARARRLLARGDSVVLDATWSDAAERDAARRLARDTSSTLAEIRCVAPADVGERRIRERVGDLSEATVEVARRMGRTYAPWPEAVEIDCAGRTENALEAAWAAVREPTGTELSVGSPTVSSTGDDVVPVT